MVEISFVSERSTEYSVESGTTEESSVYFFP